MLFLSLLYSLWKYNITVIYCTGIYEKICLVIAWNAEQRTIPCIQMFIEVKTRTLNHYFSFTVQTLFFNRHPYKTDTFVERTPVLAFLYLLYLTHYKMNISLRQTLIACPKGVHFRDSWLVYKCYPIFSTGVALTELVESDLPMKTCYVPTQTFPETTISDKKLCRGLCLKASIQNLL